MSILVDEGELAQMTAEHYLTTRKLEECQHRINELESLMQDQSFALAEARAALAEVERRFTTTYRVPLYAKQWKERHAAALKAAREAK